jgi:alkaline phosphatase
MQRIIILILIMTVFTHLSWAQRKLQHDPNKPVSVIIIIQEGVGLPALSAAQLVKGSDLNVAKASAVGLMKVSSANDVIADPAAMGTAISCGIKTNNGMIGLDTSMLPPTNLFDVAKKSKMSVGLITTSYVVDAVPAAFYAHQPKVTGYTNIANSLVDADLDVFIGGGRKFFRTKGDSTTLFKELDFKGYRIMEDYGDLRSRSNKKVAGLIKSEALESIRDGRGEYLNLAWLRAFKTLVRNDTGFVLLIHNAHTNWAATNNEKENLIAEILDMDKLLEQILNLTAPDNRTLILVIGGFETGGVTVSANMFNKSDPGLKFHTKQRTASLVPVFAFGTGASQFSGIYDNTDIFYKIKSLIE